MRALKRVVRVLVLAISFLSLYFVCILQTRHLPSTDIDDQDPSSSSSTRYGLSLRKVREFNYDTGHEDSRLLDISDFTFLKNCSARCTFSAENSVNREPYLLAFIHSAPSNFAKRRVIRETWANSITLTQLNVKTIFIIGLANDTSIERQLHAESRNHQDIVQANFVDTYKNLTYKHLTGFKWVANYCNSTQFVMKVDDDAFVDMFQVVRLLRSTFDTPSKELKQQMMVTKNKPQRPSNVLACSLFPNDTPTKRSGKWALSVDEYPASTYPAYCSGIGYFLTPDVLSQLLSTAQRLDRSKFIWIDDLFITGIVAAKANIRHQPLNHRFAYDPQRLRNWLAMPDVRSSPYIVADIGETEDWKSLMFRLWEKTARVWS